MVRERPSTERKNDASARQRRGTMLVVDDGGDKIEDRCRVVGSRQGGRRLLETREDEITPFGFLSAPPKGKLPTPFFHVYGELQGLNKQETADRFGKEKVQEWRRSYDIPPPDGESLEMCADRAVAYFKEQVRTTVDD
ncbi:hypothetical protein B296_00028519 [Ensete ventricosum]|uniref:phosphoglycerate mutase (2,3-diphosphoglycerate-dependent) n=1 Tax=Ensete ventricosum TaxID=4639 RepID=A0A426ZTZ7_ENSVE|nr:hypothetical protein B296_00028519 [Ensete ventricosum]